MNKKLTVNLNGSVIEDAKQYAKSNSVSLSKLIEAYLKHLTQHNPNQEPDITPLVQSLSDVVQLGDDYFTKPERF